MTPLIVAYLVRVKSLSLTLFLLGGVAILPALLALAAKFPPLGEVAEQGFGDLLASPFVWLCAMALFFYGPLEASLGGWATSYLVEQGVDEKSASAWLAGFWLMYMLSRLTAAIALSGVPPTMVILVVSAASIALVSYLVVCRNRTMAVVLIPLAGLIFGPIFPTLIAVLLGHVPVQLHGRAVGLFFLIGGVGWTIIPMLIGAMRSAPRSGAFVIALGAAIGLSVFALLLFLRVEGTSSGATP